MELARQLTGNRILVELEGVPEAVNVSSCHTNARIDLLSAILARVPQRKKPCGVNLGSGAANDAARDVHVRVLHHDVSGAVAPVRIPGAQILAGEVAFNSRPPERAGHDAVEPAAATERDRPRRRSEIRDDAGQYPIALLPVPARHMKREPRTIAPFTRSFERDVRAFGDEVTAIDLHSIGKDPI